jgi:predicted permease
MLAIFLKTLAIFLVILAGFVLRRRGLIDAAFNRQFSLVLVNLFYPALILHTIGGQFDWQALCSQAWLPAGSALIMASGWTVGRVLRPLLRGQTPERAQAFHLQCALNNYSFLPIMLASLLGGPRAVAQVIVSTLGAEICVWTLGVQALTGRTAWRDSLRALRSVPILAMGVAFATLLVRHAAAPGTGLAAALAAGRPLWGLANDTLQLMGQATIPACALIAGCRMADLRPRDLHSPPLIGIVLLRLAVIPALALAWVSLLPVTPDVRLVLRIVAVQPCALASVTLAEVYRGDAPFTAATVLATHAVALLSIPLWLGAVT